MSTEDPYRKLNLELYGAIISKEKEKVQKLLKEGANPNFLDRYGQSCLYEAINNKSYDIAQILINEGASPNISHGLGSLFNHLIHNLNIAGVKFLLENGAKKDNRLEIGTLGFKIAKGGYAFCRIERMLKLLLSHGMSLSPHTREEFEKYDDNAEMLNFLNCIDSFMSDFKSSNGITKLMNAASEGNLNYIKSVNPMFYNEQDDSGNTPLMYAVLSGNYAIVDHLLTEVADVSITNKENYDALYFALMYQERGIQELLLQYGALPETWKDEFPNDVKRLLSLPHVDLSLCLDTTDPITLEEISAYNAVSIRWPNNEKFSCYNLKSLLEYLKSQKYIYGLKNRDLVYTKTFPPMYFIYKESVKMFVKSLKTQRTFVAHVLYEDVSMNGSASVVYALDVYK